ncbi:hypothetical protein [Corallococcus sp. 4LFB]|uniref:hypothetical protein n=1 Tax=Corallococcus sp. 4LFB TaxID=3383249 RepID=UPI003975585D
MPTIEWDADAGILFVDDEECYADDGSGPVLMRSGLLSRLRIEDLPEEISVWPAQRVIGGSSREMHRDGSGVELSNVGGRAFVRIEDAIIRDEDTFPDAKARVVLLEQDRAAVLEKLLRLKQAGEIEEFSVSQVSEKEIIYIDLEMFLPSLRGLSLLEAVHLAVDFWSRALGPSIGPEEISRLLKSMEVLDSGGRRGAVPLEAWLLPQLASALGFEPGELHFSVRLASGAEVDAVASPVREGTPYVVFEVKNSNSSMGGEVMFEQLRSLIDEAGAPAGVLVAPKRIVAISGERRLELRAGTEEQSLVNEFYGLVGKKSVSERLVISDPGRVGSGLFKVNASRLAGLIRLINAESSAAEKGKALEDLAVLLLEGIQCVRVRERRLRTRTAEIDLVGEYVRVPQALLFEQFERYFAVECKNWDSPAGAKEIRDFLGKLEELRLSFGVYFSRSGITGRNGGADARGAISHAFQQNGRVVAVITLEDILLVARGVDFYELLDGRCRDVQFLRG